MYVYSVLLIVTIATGSAWAACGCKFTHKVTSCKEILALDPNAKSGPYILADGSEIYCVMDKRLPCSGSGWTRIANLNMAQSQQKCPSTLKYYDTDGVRVCGRKYGNCDNPIFYPSLGIEYSEICGRIVAYQYNTMDAFGHAKLTNDINSYYVCGVSITRSSPREHVWTFANSLSDTHYSSAWQGRTQCPCGKYGIPTYIPDFVGDNYYCESGNPTSGHWGYFVDDALFDNKQCGVLEVNCCNKGIIPYFQRDMVTKNADDVEVRLCADEAISNEDIRVSVIELYIR